MGSLTKVVYRSFLLEKSLLYRLNGINFIKFFNIYLKEHSLYPINCCSNKKYYTFFNKYGIFKKLIEK